MDVDTIFEPGLLLLKTRVLPVAVDVSDLEGRSNRAAAVAPLDIGESHAVGFEVRHPVVNF